MAYTPLTARTFRASPSGSLPIVVRMAPGDIEVFALDLTDCMLASDTVSGIPAWSTSSSVVTLGGENLNGGTQAVVLVTAGSAEGEALLTCSATVTLNNRTFKRSIAIHVRSPLA